MSKNLMKVWFFLIVFCAAGPMGAWNYMVDFPMYLPKAYVLLSLCLLLFIDFKKSVLLKYLHVLVLLMSCIFWGTKWHVFGGDMATGPIDLNYAISFRRLSELLLTLWTRFFFNYYPMDQLDKLPSVVCSEMFYSFFGVLTVLMVFFTFRKNPVLFWFVSTGAWMLNCFGNIDAYTPSLFYALVLFNVHIHYLKKGYTWKRWILFVCLMLVGLWVHPLFIFMLILPVSEFLKLLPFLKWKAPFWVLFFLALAALMKMTSFSPKWFVYDEKQFAPIFSMFTAINVFNHFILLLVPLVFCLWRTKWWIVWIGSCLVLSMLAFSMGSVDQFNYQQITLMLVLVGLAIGIEKGVDWSPLWDWVPIQLWLLLCAIVVSSTDANLERAKRLYPLDKGHHNNVMSWQTHLGIVIMDNTQEGEAAKEAALEVFRSGTTNFNAGLNHCLYVSAHYNYGMILEGRKAMSNLLVRAPHLVGTFLSARPAFAFNNRVLLWEDVLRYYPAHNEQEQAHLAYIVHQLKKDKDKVLYRKSKSVYEKE